MLHDSPQTSLFDIDHFLQRDKMYQYLIVNVMELPHAC